MLASTVLERCLATFGPAIPINPIFIQYYLTLVVTHDLLMSFGALQGMEVLKNLNQQHQKRQESLVVHATSAPDIDDLEEQVEQLHAELEEQAAENSQLQEDNVQLREENSDLRTKNGRLVWVNLLPIALHPVVSDASSLSPH